IRFQVEEQLVESENMVFGLQPVIPGVRLAPGQGGLPLRSQHINPFSLVSDNPAPSQNAQADDKGKKSPEDHGLPSHLLESPVHLPEPPLKQIGSRGELLFFLAYPLLVIHLSAVLLMN